jgi:hypothetical protein
MPWRQVCPELHTCPVVVVDTTIYRTRSAAFLPRDSLAGYSLPAARLSELRVPGRRFIAGGKVGERIYGRDTSAISLAIVEYGPGLSGIRRIDAELLPPGNPFGSWIRCQVKRLRGRWAITRVIVSEG